MHAALPVALPDQHPRLADGAVPRRSAGAATLDDVPDAELDRSPRLGFDWVWLLSVWQTGAGGAAQSRAATRMARRVPTTSCPTSATKTSPARGFAITGYHVHARLRRRRGARPPARAAARARPAADARLRAQPHRARSSVGRRAPRVLRRGHRTRPGRARRRTTRRVRRGTGDRILAYGRDPYFAGWPDTLQLNYAQSRHCRKR